MRLGEAGRTTAKSAVVPFFSRWAHTLVTNDFTKLV
ncbi:hypothetical protein LMG22037_06532 [Paraburkholderia phenoliruptrix]|uniref:Uncharacterized protein n=1 Tax=Paraburkholderia phenoliruptrix TaxID=252970 RepID=A0A6J5CRB4_9BURK|nr:hypothetical protein LMG22037_06532 [Paraburkholderia phenoliruptrix]